MVENPLLAVRSRYFSPPIVIDDHLIIGLLDYWIIGLLDYWTNMIFGKSR